MVDKIFVPPIKIQGIKTKLVPLIKRNVSMTDGCTWVEPFMGSGVVGFNIESDAAIFADLNPHIINFYDQLKRRIITSVTVREFLEEQGTLLRERDDAHYYEVRERFNATHDPLDFLFLDRSCFNGMIRFNRNGDFNVPYGHKPERFARAYITKIVNQIARVELMLRHRDCTFVCQSFERTIDEAPSNAFIYCDPPYIDRHVDYYDSWDAASETALHDHLTRRGLPFMVSTWDHNEFRTNRYVDMLWGSCNKVTTQHFYHVGARETNRKPMVEALLMNYAPRTTDDAPTSRSELDIYRTA